MDSMSSLHNSNDWTRSFSMPFLSYIPDAFTAPGSMNSSHGLAKRSVPCSAGLSSNANEANWRRAD